MKFLFGAKFYRSEHETNEYIKTSFNNNSVRLVLFSNKDVRIDFDSERFIKDTISIGDYYVLLEWMAEYVMFSMWQQMKRAEKKIKRKERSKLKNIVNKAFCGDITYNIMSFIK